MRMCECTNSEDFCQGVTHEEWEYLSEIHDGLYLKSGYFILNIKCAKLEEEAGESRIIEVYKNAALTQWIKTKIE